MAYAQASPDGMQVALILSPREAEMVAALFGPTCGRPDARYDSPYEIYVAVSNYLRSQGWGARGNLFEPGWVPPTWQIGADFGDIPDVPPARPPERRE